MTQNGVYLRQKDLHIEQNSVSLKFGQSQIFCLSRPIQEIELLFCFLQMSPFSSVMSLSTLHAIKAVCKLRLQNLIK